MDVLVILLDQTLRVMMINRKAESVLQKPSDQILGRDVSVAFGEKIVLQQGLQRVKKILRHLVKTGKSPPDLDPASLD